MQTFDEILFVRDAFAHSFVELEEIKHRKVPLKYCFGSTYCGRSYVDFDASCSIFMDDVQSFFTPIASAFSCHQLSQIDRDKFFKFCDHVLKPRTLAR